MKLKLNWEKIEGIFFSMASFGGYFAFQIEEDMGLIWFEFQEELYVWIVYYNDIYVDFMNIDFLHGVYISIFKFVGKTEISPATHDVYQTN